MTGKPDVLEAFGLTVLNHDPQDETTLVNHGDEEPFWVLTDSLFYEIDEGIPFDYYFWKAECLIQKV